MESNLKELVLLGLTEEDFDLIIEGLENLPNKNLAGEMMGDLIANMLPRNEDQQNEVKKLREEEKLKNEKLKAKLKEDIKLLQSKIILFKRYMMKNKLLEKCN